MIRRIVITRGVVGFRQVAVVKTHHHHQVVFYLTVWGSAYWQHGGACGKTETSTYVCIQNSIGGYHYRKCSRSSHISYSCAKHFIGIRQIAIVVKINIYGELGITTRHVHHGYRDICRLAYHQHVGGKAWVEAVFIGTIAIGVGTWLAVALDIYRGAYLKARDDLVTRAVIDAIGGRCVILGHIIARARASRAIRQVTPVVAHHLHDIVLYLAVCGRARGEHRGDKRSIGRETQAHTHVRVQHCIHRYCDAHVHRSHVAHARSREHFGRAKSAIIIEIQEHHQLGRVARHVHYRDRQGRRLACYEHRKHGKAIFVVACRVVAVGVRALLAVGISVYRRTNLDVRVDYMAWAIATALGLVVARAGARAAVRQVAVVLLDKTKVDGHITIVVKGAIVLRATLSRFAGRLRIRNKGEHG